MLPTPMLENFVLTFYFSYERGLVIVSQTSPLDDAPETRFEIFHTLDTLRVYDLSEKLLPVTAAFEQPRTLYDWSSTY